MSRDQLKFYITWMLFIDFWIVRSPPVRHFCDRHFFLAVTIILRVHFFRTNCRLMKITRLRLSCDIYWINCCITDQGWSQEFLVGVVDLENLGKIFSGRRPRKIIWCFSQFYQVFQDNACQAQPSKYVKPNVIITLSQIDINCSKKTKQAELSWAKLSHIGF